MERILVAASTVQTQQNLRALIQSDTAEIQCVHSGGEVRRLLALTKADIVVINHPLGDESGEDLAMHIAATTDAIPLLLARTDVAELIMTSMTNAGVIVVPKPLSRAAFHQAFRMARAYARRLQGPRNTNAKLKSKLEEIQYVDRAKYVLIRVLNMTESQAHRYIEKQAMDLRVSKKEVARDLLNTYEP